MKKLLAIVTVISGILIPSIINAATFDYQTGEVYQSISISKNLEDEFNFQIPVAVDLNTTTSFEIKGSGNVASYHEFLIKAIDTYDVTEAIDFKILETNTLSESNYIIGKVDTPAFLFNNIDLQNGKTVTVNILTNKELPAGNWLGKLHYKVDILNNQILPGYYLYDENGEKLNFCSFYDVLYNTDETAKIAFRDYINANASTIKKVEIVFPKDIGEATPDLYIDMQSGNIVDSAITSNNIPTTIQFNKQGVSKIIYYNCTYPVTLKTDYSNADEIRAILTDSNSCIDLSNSVYNANYNIDLSSVVNEYNAKNQ